jgi:formylglycine-generating enzyme required for sulfatase activity
VYVPPGQFIMGRVGDIRIVSLEKGFLIEKYLVTNAEFCAFLNERGNGVEDGVKWINSYKCRIWQEEGLFYIEPGYEEHPVIYVSWYGAKAYAEWLGRRLPTKEEWEKAARGIDGRVYPWGNELDSTRCNTSGESTPVNKYPEGVSPFGCFDMVGTVWEWNDSWYDEKWNDLWYGEKWRDRVLRGGSGTYKEGVVAPCAERVRGYLDGGDLNIGFRCVRDL